jgi:acetyltransferase-like isoleucine patch superfamily enzyme
MPRSAARRLRRFARRALDAPREIRESGGVRAWALFLPGPVPWLMSWLRKRWAIFSNPHGHIEFRGVAYCGPGFRLVMPTGGTIIIGHGVEFRRGFRAEIGPTGRVEIGDLCTFTYDVIVSCESAITFEERTLIGQGAYVVDGNHRFRDRDQHFLDQGYTYRELRIGPEAAVHSKCTVVNDIGERAIIGANSLITKPIPAWCVAGGVPAKILDYYGPPGDEPPEWLERSASRAPTSG